MNESKTAPGPFERHGLVPDMRSIGKIIRAEATREVVAYLEREGVLDGVNSWEALGVPDRETWIRAITDVFQKASRTASTAAIAELRAREALALELHCRKCGAQEGKACWDMRTKQRVHIAHPHQERMDDIEAEAAAS
jgi:hypothetical protein